MKFTEESQIHEIPPKPKRTKPVEKRSRSAPNLEDLKNPKQSTSEVKIVAVEQGQRVSMTSLEDLKKFDSTKNMNSREKDDLNKVNLNLARF